MKLKLLLFTISFVFGLHFIFAQSDKIAFSETIFDFGTIGERDGNVVHDFIITNMSDEPLVITKVQATCGCTTPDYTKAPIEPGKSGKISVSYNPYGNSGNVTKTIRVATNSEANIVLTIKANVEKGQFNPTKKYPIAIQTLLFKTKPQLNFDLVTSDSPKLSYLAVYNNSDSDIETSKAFSLPDYITVEPQIIPAKESIQLHFSIDAAKVQKTGFLTGNITLSTNAKSKGSIPYTLVIKENFDNLTAEEKQEKGRINLNVNHVSFSKGEKFFILKIANSGKSKLNIKGIQSPDSNISFSKKHFSVKPNRIEEVKITYAVNKLNTIENSTIYIISDDPDNSVEKISVLARP